MSCLGENQTTEYLPMLLCESESGLFIIFLLTVDISQQTFFIILFIYALILALRLRYTVEGHSGEILTFWEYISTVSDPDMPRKS